MRIGDPQQMQRKFTDEEIEWLSERVRYYVRHKNYTSIARAIERALADFRAFTASA